MKKSIKLLTLPLLLTFLFFSCEKMETADYSPHKANATSLISLPSDVECFASVDLIAAQHHYAGKVNVTRCDGGVKVQFVTENNWILTEVHVDVQNDPNVFPMTKSGNPKVGHFFWNVSFDPSENKMIYETECIPVAEGDIYVAAHAVVCGGLIDDIVPDFGAFCASIPDTATLQVVSGGLAYTTSTIVGTNSWIDGTYPGWCVDLSRSISGYPPNEYNVEVVPSVCGAPLQGLIDYPANIGLVNYLLNQPYLGMDLGDLGVITISDIQAVIWMLLDDGENTRSYDEARASWIKADVEANGSTFMPGCGDMVAILLVPRDKAGEIVAQITIIPLPLPCYAGCETAWGKGYGFPGKQWAMFFKYCD